MKEAKVEVIEEGKESRVITVSQAKEEAKSFNPYNLDNVLLKGNERSEMLHNLPSSEFGSLTMDLERLIAHLISIKEKYGNMPVLYFNAKTGCFTEPSDCDIDVIPKYFIVRANLKRQFMKIYNKKALSFFHC